MAISGLDLSPGIDTTRPNRSVSPALLAYLEHRRQRVVALIDRCVGDEAARSELRAMLGLDEPADLANDGYPRCGYDVCGHPFMPRIPSQRYCQPLCALRHRTRPPQDRTLQPTPTGQCPDCHTLVPLTPVGRIGRHCAAGAPCRGFIRHPEVPDLGGNETRRR